MSSRIPRRSFTAPFVLTLAAALPACSKSKAPAAEPGSNKAGEQELLPMNQPPPDPTLITNAPLPTPTANPPAPAPTDKQVDKPTGLDAVAASLSTTRDQRWTVTTHDGKCMVRMAADCPPGGIGSCNPPAPRGIRCQGYIDDPKPGAMLAIVQPDGSKDCFGEIPGDPKSRRKVACPEW